MEVYFPSAPPALACVGADDVAVPAEQNGEITTNWVLEGIFARTRVTTVRIRVNVGIEIPGVCT